MELKAYGVSTFDKQVGEQRDALPGKLEKARAVEDALAVAVAAKPKATSHGMITNEGCASSF